MTLNNTGIRTILAIAALGLAGLKLSNNGTASGDSVPKTAGFVGGIRTLMAAPHVSIEVSGFLSVLARHLMLTRHARANAKMTLSAVSWPSAGAEPTWMGTVALCLRAYRGPPCEDALGADRPVGLGLRSSWPPGRPRRLVCRAIWCAG